MFTTSICLLEQLRAPLSPQTCATDAWTRFVALYTPLLHHWACRLPGMQEADAVDLVQDVFVLLLQKLPQLEYQPGGSFRGWLRTMLLNRWRDRRKDQSPVLSLSQPQVAEPACDDPLEELSDAEYRQYLVGRAMELMRTDFAEATWQACWECVGLGRDPTEVAAELGLSVAAVYVGKSRILRRLRQELQGLLD